MYSKYITLVENSSIINPFKEKDQLLVLDSKLLISNDEDTISTNNSNDNNPIISNNNNLNVLMITLKGYSNYFFKSL